MAVNKQDIGFLRKIAFEVVVYDEGHYLKNANAIRSKELFRIQSKMRILLTGTPVFTGLRRRRERGE